MVMCNERHLHLNGDDQVFYILTMKVALFQSLSFYDDLVILIANSSHRVSYNWCAIIQKHIIKKMSKHMCENPLLLSVVLLCIFKTNL